MKRTQSTFLIAAASLLIASFAVTVHAQTTPAPTSPAVSFEESCQRIKNRLNVRVGNVTDAKDKNSAIYEAINKQVQTIIDTAEDKGYDTSGLDSALQDSRTLIATYNDANKSYTNQLTATAGTACQSETSYALNIATTRTALKTAREAGLDVRSVYQYTVLPELRAYKVWLSDLAAKENV